MSALLEFQRQVADALLTGDRAAAARHFQGTDGRRQRGLKVYANNLMHALVSALRETFPAVSAAIGEAAFMSLAVTYARGNPPIRDTLLIGYGAGFPGFLDGVRIAHAPWMADLARLELAWVEAYHAAEAVPLTLGALATLTPEQLVDARLLFHPSVRLLRSDYDVAMIWQTQRGCPAATDGAYRADQAAGLVVLRPFNEVLVLPASSLVFGCITRLGGGSPFGAAAEHLAGAGHLAELQALIGAGAFIGLEAADST